MNKFKKVGLTALAGSLVVTSAVAGEMSVSGGAVLVLRIHQRLLLVSLGLWEIS